MQLLSGQSLVDPLVQVLVLHVAEEPLLPMVTVKVPFVFGQLLEVVVLPKVLLGTGVAWAAWVWQGGVAR